MPHCRKGIQVDENVSLVDIMPTVLDLLGLKSPSRVDGMDLRSALEGGQLPDAQRAIYAESLEAATFECTALHAIVNGPWKYILAPRPELYDLSKDPGELTNLANAGGAAASRAFGVVVQNVDKGRSSAARRWLIPRPSSGYSRWVM